MPRDAEVREWWADVSEVRERIERRRATEPAASESRAPHRRGVREVRTTGMHLPQMTPQEPDQAAAPARRRPRPRPVQRLGPRPDRIAAWAVALGVLLLLIAILSAHS